MHQSVLYHEIISLLKPSRGGTYVDCTVGSGGHAWGILDASRPDGLLLGLDVDPQALTLARERLAEFNDRVTLIKASYKYLLDHLVRLSWSRVDGILLDLGVSSMQLGTVERGFSFLEEGPLDMRFDPENPITAAKLVNTLSEMELAHLLFKYGEEKRSRRIARLIVANRPINSTKQLADLVSSAESCTRKRIHPATLTFQALRIAVNSELQSIEDVLPQAIKVLKRFGRLAIVSYHSLEDRLVKRYFKQESQNCICPPNIPQCQCGHLAQVKLISLKPIRPTQNEITQNYRARSAKLRVVEKL